MRASKSPVCASRCSASGVSSAPGTVTTVTPSSATLASRNARSAPASNPSPMDGLNRDRTMATRMWAPARSGAIRLTDMSRLGRLALRKFAHVAGDFEIEPRHAGHLARLGEKTHAADVQVAQDLRADAVVAQVEL